MNILEMLGELIKQRNMLAGKPNFTVSKHEGPNGTILIWDCFTNDLSIMATQKIEDGGQWQTGISIGWTYGPVSDLEIQDIMELEADETITKRVNALIKERPSIVEFLEVIVELLVEKEYEKIKAESAGRRAK